MQFYNVKLLIYSKLDLALYYMVPSTQLRVASAAIVITICILGYTAKWVLRIVEKLVADLWFWHTNWERLKRGIQWGSKYGD